LDADFFAEPGLPLGLGGVGAAAATAAAAPVNGSDSSSAAAAHSDSDSFAEAESRLQRTLHVVWTSWVDSSGSADISSPSLLVVGCEGEIASAAFALLGATGTADAAAALGSAAASPDFGTSVSMSSNGVLDMICTPIREVM